MKRRHSLRDSYQAKLRKEIAEGIERRVGLKRTELARKSVKQKKRDTEYSRVRKAFLEAHPRCQACLRLNKIPNMATDIHHRRGKAGSLLCDTRGFLAVDRACHEWIHEHPRDARALDLLAPAALWNVPFPKENEKEH